MAEADSDFYEEEAEDLNHVPEPFREKIPVRRTAAEVLNAKRAQERQFYMGVDVTDYSPRERKILQRKLRQDFEVRNEPSFWNRQIKVYIKRINSFILFISVGIVGLALYVVCSNWGNLEPGFFLGSGLVLMLFGVIVSLLSFLGRFGVKKRIPPSSYFQRDKVLPIYLIFLLAAIFGEAYLLSFSLEAHTQFQAAEDAIHTLSQTGSNTDAAKYGSIEMAVAQKFNSFFFGAATSCLMLKYGWFWAWITKHCPDGLQPLRCLSCAEYSITSCEADAYSCFSPQSDNTQACPYALCRSNTLAFMKYVLFPFNWGLVAFIALSCLVVIWTIMLLVYRKRADINLAAALVQSGTLPASEEANNGSDYPVVAGAEGDLTEDHLRDMPLGSDLEYAYEPSPPHYDQVMISDFANRNENRESLGIGEFKP